MTGLGKHEGEVPPSGRRLHVLALVRSFGFPHGMAPTQRLRLVARALVEQGVDVRIVITRVSERPPVIRNTEMRGAVDGVAFEYTTGSTLRSSSFAVRRWREARGTLVAALRLARLRHAGRLDVVYLWGGSRHWRLVPWLWTKALRLAGIPVVVEQNEMPSILLPRRSPADRLASPIRDADGHIAISRWLAQWIRGEATRQGREAAVVEVPILMDAEEQSMSPYPDDRDGDGMVVFAASSAYEETTRFVIEAMRLVWEDYPTCRLVVTGVNPADPRAAWLLRQGQAGELDDRVELPGYLERGALLALYGEARALLVPLFDDVRSRARFPTKIAEYAAAARPIVATSVGEVERYFSDEVDAFMCAPGDVKSYAGAICRALEDPRRSEAVGLAGRELALRTFDYRLHGPRLAAFFQEVADRACDKRGTRRGRRGEAGRAATPTRHGRVEQ